MNADMHGPPAGLAAPITPRTATFAATAPSNSQQQPRQHQHTFSVPTFGPAVPHLPAKTWEHSLVPTVPGHSGGASTGNLNPALADRVDSSEVTFWDGWPDGEFERDFTWQEMADTKDLMVHWAYHLTGGDRKGDIFGDTWPEGKRAKRWCLGTIVCDNEECETMVQPQTKPEGISKQLLSKCQCGARLRHDDCGLVSELWKYKDGIHYINGGYHQHPRPTHILHLSPN